ncbi:hypothetical protein CAPTEDRAFT_196578 [Capitella teleta]|uniref:Insulin-like domain-containing protein n=1 Tax=Capitella teleta TaxID=283909 RepID=R7TPQ9_CAPTE|nr:hypothetical protein CAPTEDRAFT_196578 [Capitella teleta]|eukprot:ELT95557.1 hypothetical protein CAPTEDRAFT_196578 [Capitella teleta]
MSGCLWNPGIKVMQQADNFIDRSASQRHGRRTCTHRIGQFCLFDDTEVEISMAHQTLSSVWSSAAFLCVTVVLTLTFISVEAGRRKCSMDDYRAGAPKRGFICGNQIPQTLSLVCGGSYRRPGKRNTDSLRSEWSFLGGRGDEDSHKDQENALNADDLDRASIDDLDPAAIWDNVFLPRANALSVLRSKRSNMKEGGVYCECCVHRCTYPELLSYCAVDREKRDVLLTSVATNNQKESML